MLFLKIFIDCSWNRNADGQQVECEFIGTIRWERERRWPNCCLFPFRNSSIRFIVLNDYQQIIVVDCPLENHVDFVSLHFKDIFSFVWFFCIFPSEIVHSKNNFQKNFPDNENWDFGEKNFFFLPTGWTYQQVEVNLHWMWFLFEILGFDRCSNLVLWCSVKFFVNIWRYFKIILTIIAIFFLSFNKKWGEMMLISEGR